MINLTKGSSPVSLSKGTLLLVRISWPAATDYDAGAEILYRDGTTESIATFGTVKGQSNHHSRNNSVAHLGDMRRGSGTAEEIIEIYPDAEIEKIVPWAYSAQSNGTGSFRKYAVSMEIEAGDDTVRIDASNASKDDAVYTCVPGIISFDADGTPSVEYREEYSSPGSELRPTFFKSGLFGGLKFTMNGPRNKYK